MIARPAMLGTAAALLLLAAPGVTQSLAQGTLKTTRLSAALAHDVVTAAVETCTQRGERVSAVVLDPAGVQQAFLRGDGAGIHTVEMADYKAYTALSFRTDGIDMVERSKSGNVPAAIAKLPRLVLAQGGVLIKAGDEIVGVIGVSGARGNNIDTQCAHAAIDKIKDQVK
jgi:uncharacterized protein GlcG (DUF336 family)